MPLNSRCSPRKPNGYAFPSRGLAIRLLCILLPLLPASAASLEKEIKSATHDVLQRKDSDANEFDWLHQRWVKYRDAEAALEAWSAGRIKPDEAARARCVERLDRAWLKDLRTIAATGDFADLKPGSYQGADQIPGGLGPNDDLPLRAIYTDLRERVIATKTSGLIASLIQSESAWLWYAGLQADGEGYLKDGGPGRRNLAMADLGRRRVDELQQVADTLGIALAPHPIADQLYGLDQDTVVSPDNSLRIEQAARDVWVVSNETNVRARLPEYPHGDDHTQIGMPSEFEFSPGNQWILRTQKIYHLESGAYLYKRVPRKVVGYERATREPLDILAWKFFQKAAKVPSLDPTAGGVINFRAWKPEPCNSASTRVFFQHPLKKLSTSSSNTTCAKARSPFPRSFKTMTAQQWSARVSGIDWTADCGTASPLKFLWTRLNPT
jgi:hypothetical protein